MEKVQRVRLYKYDRQSTIAIYEGSMEEAKRLLATIVAPLPRGEAHGEWTVNDVVAYVNGGNSGFFIATVSDSH